MRELIHPGQLTGFSARVVGAGASGRGAVKLLCALGADVRLLDNGSPSDETRELCERLGVPLDVGEHTKSQFEGADLVVLSPGIARSTLDEVLEDVADRKVVAELELASWFTSEPVIAVTGTNGKTTTASLTAAMLKAGGKNVFLGGNIGTPLSEYLVSDQRADILVLEVSSFQLQNCRSFKPHVGVLLNFSPNHLDYHRDMEEYLAAKLNLFARQTDKDLAIAPLELKKELTKREWTKAKQAYFVPTDRFKSDKLIGPHNQANMEAAWLAARAFGVTEEQAGGAVAAFEPKPHRLQVVADVNGVLFVDDSKATTIEALGAALMSFDRPIRLLAGGRYKGGDPSAIKHLVEQRVASVCLFGESREVFEPAWEGAASISWEATLEPAVKRLYAESEPGDVILLSPATSSFDLYENYKARGDDFRRIAEGLA
ncbi:UDP-N-acetylmuramoyl-L-alanine--D-glutamate ligase [Desulfohalovibrio reitneri]|uniref:UDP-N-acetylmuramoyl-L-alanine--D-glutamate ligase n=1 Tax=Desulfohalovibrio reitneri TaxID=1307759 RepID=UPI0004A73752|nr:UDP-N-acetylmuramoyl-L-alanine--D-glutamate ligase [Desulfohalovibrio reitneri]